MTFDFAQPLALLLLLLLPAFWLIDRISRTHLPRKRRRLVLAVRMLVVALLVLGLAGPRYIGQADEQAVAFLVDVSDSVTPPMRERQLAFMRDATAEMTDRDKSAVIAFASQAVVERPLSGPRPIGPVASIVEGGRTDLAGAIRLALDEPVLGYAQRAAELLEPFRPAAIDRTVADELLPRLLGSAGP
jgi:hypothetical protein